MRFNSMFGEGCEKTALDYTRTTEPIYSEVQPYAVDIQTGEVINKTSRLIVVKSGEFDIDEKIQSFAGDCDIYKILEKFALTGDSSFVNQRVGSFGDFVNIPDNINDFSKYVDKNINVLKSMDPEVAEEVLKDNLSAEAIEKMIQDKIKAAMIAASDKEATVNE